MGMDFKTATVPLGMLLNLVNSCSAALTYGRNGLIAWRVAVPFAITMIAFAPLGTWLNIRLQIKPLLVIFALISVGAAVLMLSGWKPRRSELSNRGLMDMGLTAGSLLGTIAGLIGRGGESFVVPLLYIAGLDPKVAAATSALTVSSSGLSSFTSHLVAATQPQWGIWLGTVVAVLLGSQLGSRLIAERMKPRAIKKVFGLVLLGVATLIIVKDVVFA
jgi:hypothetical protein